MKITKKTNRIKEITTTTNPSLLFNEISRIIEESKQRVAKEFNSTLVLLNWTIGYLINKAILSEKRAEYGEQVIDNLAKQLTLKYGKGYSRPNLFRMIRFTKLFPEREIVSTLSRQFSWSHMLIFCSIEDDLKRDFYIQMCSLKLWSIRLLEDKIDGMLFERTALSKKPDEVIRRQLQHVKDTGELLPDIVFRDPCFLNFTWIYCFSIVAYID